MLSTSLGFDSVEECSGSFPADLCLGYGLSGSTLHYCIGLSCSGWYCSDEEHSPIASWWLDIDLIVLLFVCCR